MRNFVQNDEEIKEIDAWIKQVRIDLKKEYHQKAEP